VIAIALKEGCANADISTMKRAIMVVVACGLMFCASVSAAAAGRLTATEYQAVAAYAAAAQSAADPKLSSPEVFRRLDESCTELGSGSAFLERYTRVCRASVGLAHNFTEIARVRTTCRQGSRDVRRACSARPYRSLGAHAAVLRRSLARASGLLRARQIDGACVEQLLGGDRVRGAVSALAVAGAAASRAALSGDAARLRRHGERIDRAMATVADEASTDVRACRPR